ncbi:diaminopimelate epimerase [Phytoactinopolyspora limicola]|uniref:diaminopimelate epimerase n=1 Tax=Phytoactinopolyspora limicola TaxID=2715536 RepID=UPI00140D2986|nr:diaminopimelate epimerase [Phytoactinopolyspora limicola]
MGVRAEFVKGHGTENDFVVVPDPADVFGDVLDAPTVRRLTDRYAGIGADGLIRVVPARPGSGPAEWFMDYRNADGTLAEMCGNGVRVMAAYLLDAGLVEGKVLTVATRGGNRTVRAEADGEYTVEMGPAAPMGQGPADLPGSTGVTVTMGERSWPAVPVAVPNPHAVIFLDDDAVPDADPQRGDPNRAVDDIPALVQLGMLTGAPVLSPEPVFPEGANVEFVVRRGERHLALRVWERGVGETRSCGTGVCAAAWAAMARDGASGAVYTVDVPGGRLLVTERADGELLLTGPAVLGVHGHVEL